jgi:hypothetical protein
METTSIDNQIDEIIKDNKLFRFASELQDTTDDERKKQLKIIIQLLQGKEPDDAHKKLHEMYKDIDKQIYEQRWTKLTKAQKIVKIKEFLKSNISDSEERKNIETELIQLVNNGRLRTIRDVTYDSKQSKIITISILKFNDGKYLIDKKKK